jgi:hypothetical protein
VQSGVYKSDHDFLSLYVSTELWLIMSHSLSSVLACVHFSSNAKQDYKFRRGHSGTQCECDVMECNKNRYFH